MIERVARVLVGNWPEGTVYQLVTEGGETTVFKPAWLAMEDQARKVIEAMREPTQVMMDQTSDVEGFDDSARATWEAMIDAALATPPRS